MDSKRRSGSAFYEIPYSPLAHFRLHFYAAIFNLIYYIQRLNEYGGMGLNEVFNEFPFLGSYFSEMFVLMPEELEWDQASEWWDTQIRLWENASPTHLPLVALAKGLKINFRQRIALMLVGLVEEDTRFGTLFEKLQAPLSYRQPCQELLGQVLLDSAEEETIEVWDVFQSLEEFGLLEFSNKNAPHSEWLPRVPLLLWDVINGSANVLSTGWGSLKQASCFPHVEELIYPDDFVKQLEQIPNLLVDGTTSVIVLRGSQGSDSLQIFGAIARALNLDLISLSEDGSTIDPHWKIIGPLCILQRVMPILRYSLHPGETVKVPEFGAYQGPVGIIVGNEGGLSGKMVEKALTLRVPVLTAPYRLRHWEQAFDGHPVENLSEINRRFQLPDGYIRKLATISIARAELEEQQTVKVRHVQEACRSLNRQMLDRLATRLEVGGSWERLIVSSFTAAKLHELERRCVRREQILDHLSPAYDLDANRGVRALFSGKSGTGKTMAAKILAATLGMDLYRADLSAVINKYVGETEKNLHRLLSRAEELDVVLLLDEGDALLGSRTKVKSANDRFANLETNYLLQKLETYQGIVIVTSNVSENIDRAFQRRMDIVVNFVSPRAEERLRIWELHLPSEHAVEETYLDEISSRCAITGGQIRNAALFATLLALEDGGTIQQHHLELAIRSEYQKAGAANPLENGKPSHGKQRDVLAFINVLD